MAGSNGKDKDKAKKEELRSRRLLLASKRVKNAGTKGGDDPKQRDKGKGKGGK